MNNFAALFTILPIDNVVAPLDLEKEAAAAKTGGWNSLSCVSDTAGNGGSGLVQLASGGGDDGEGLTLIFADFE